MTRTDLLVISAHSADYVWRSGGIIAKYRMKGKNVKVYCLSFGERGESTELWVKGHTLPEIKEIRRDESQKAADILGVEVSFLDWDDYPLLINIDRLAELVKIIRKENPLNLLTHSPTDPFNIDHETTAKSVKEASILSIAHGFLPEIPAANQTRLFGFEHHQPELSEFYPDIIIDISEAFEKKKAAMNCFKTQKHLIDYYAMRAELRGNHFRRISGTSNCKYAEAFKRVYPLTSEEFL
ncbi:MAG: PIG-L deacetylase family protein [Thermoplasmatales archaeon]